MERLSTAAAITGLLAVSGTIIDILWDVNVSPLADTAVVNLTLREVKEGRSSINALTKALRNLESRQVPFPDRASWIGVDELIATLTDMVLAFSKLYALCSSVEAEAARSTSATASRKYEKRLRALAARIKWHNLSIAMMMTIINCPAETDAKNSRDELVHRITRLLTFNVSLSSRMQRGISSSYTGMSPPISAASSTSSMSASASVPAASSSSSDPLPSNLPSTRASPAGVMSAKPSDVGRIPRSSPGWPTTSGFTLADAAILSLIRLPICVVELRDDRDYYPVTCLPSSGYEFGHPGGMDQSSIRSISITPSPPGSSWEPTEINTVVATQIAGPASAR